MKRYPFTPHLGWSVTRYDVFSTCRRKYFYSYYGKHDRENWLRISSLKSLTSVALEIGVVTHLVFEKLLKRFRKTGHPIDRERFLEFSRKLAIESAKIKTFSEVYYDGRREIDADSDLMPKIELSLTNFLESKRAEWLVQTAASSREDWIIEPPGFGETRIGNAKAYFRIDFLFSIDDKIIVIDWKTGKPTSPAPGETLDSHTKQMIAYTVWVHNEFGKDYSDIETILAYLAPEYAERPVVSAPSEIDAFAALIAEQTHEMYQYCSDIDENVPKPKEFFEMTANTANCRFCNFRELCGGETT